ncbi:MAG: ABC transporter permease [Thermoleophilia bacterium]
MISQVEREAPSKARRTAVAAALGVTLGVTLALTAGALLMALLGADPLLFYARAVEQGLLSWSGFQDVLIRTAPLLLIASGLVIAFRANIWNIGGDGQFLVAAAAVAGAAPLLAGRVSHPIYLAVLFILAAAVGALWALVPALLKARYAFNEVVTSLMMAFVGVNLANMLVKGPFRSSRTLVPQTDVVGIDWMLPRIPGTRVHVGLILAFLCALGVGFVLRETSFGLRLRVLGESPRAAAHAGLPAGRLVVAAFMASGALIGSAAAVEVLGVWGYMRADWNPALGLPLFALVFLSRLRVAALVPLVGFYAVLSMGGHYAARQAHLPDDMVLMLVGVVIVSLILAPAAYRRRRVS